MSATNSTFMQQFEDCKTLVNRVKAAADGAKPGHWLLMAPDGRVFEGSPQDVARALLQNIDLAEEAIDAALAQMAGG